APLAAPVVAQAMPVMSQAVSTAAPGAFVLPVDGPFGAPQQAMDGPVPAFMAPPPPPGVAELSFAQSLPEPAIRASKGAAPPSKAMLYAGYAIAGLIAIAFVVAVGSLGRDPVRGNSPKKAEVKTPQPRSQRPTEADGKIEDVFARINESNK